MRSCTVVPTFANMIQCEYIKALPPRPCVFMRHAPAFMQLSAPSMQSCRAADIAGGLTIFIVCFRMPNQGPGFPGLSRLLQRLKCQSNTNAPHATLPPVEPTGRSPPTTFLNSRHTPQQLAGMLSLKQEVDMVKQPEQPR